MRKPKLLVTLGDVAGVGPEIVAKAWFRLQAFADPIVVGDADWIRHGCELVGIRGAEVPSVNPSTVDLEGVRTGEVTAEAGKAAYDWLCYAIDECIAGRADGIVTCPLHKEGLHAAGVPYPGHTEVLAARTGAKSHAMLLFDEAMPLAVAHVTLHMALRDVFAHLTTDAILAKVRLLHEIVPKLIGRGPARIAVAALNPHASDGGLFGDEEAGIIAPAVEAAIAEGIAAVGPLAADAIFLPQNRATYDGVVAMYHDQGHIAMKLVGGRRAVNVTAGLPIVRTSVAHGTAYDIAGTGQADESSLVSAVRVAAKLAGG